MLLWFSIFVISIALFIHDHYVNDRNPLKHKPLPKQLLDFVFKTILSNLIPVKVENATRNIKGQPVLFVCNHQLGGCEILALFTTIYNETGVYPRGLADYLWFRFPIASTIMKYLGAIEGKRDLCNIAMKAGHPLLVFPGGSNEVLRTSETPRYTLQWGERKGFARLAVENGYKIIPVSSIGADEMFSIIFDLPISFIFYLIGDKRAYKNPKMPILIPNLDFQRQYIQIGEVIETAGYKGDTSEETISLVRDKTRDAINKGFTLLKEIRSKDPKRKIFKLKTN